MMGSTFSSRRGFLKLSVLGASGAVVVAACAPAAPPAAPTAAPAPTAQAAAKPTEAAKPAAQPTPAAQAKPAGVQFQGKLTVVRQAAAIGMPGQIEPLQAAWEKALELYKKAQPGISIEETTIPAGDYGPMTQFITTGQAAGNLPDLVNHWVGPTNREEDENKSPWVRTTDYLDATNPYTGNVWRKDFEPDVLAYQLGTLQYNYALAVDRNAFAWVYNKTLFDQKGWKVPQKYSEFTKLLATIKQAGVIPIAEYATPTSWITNHPIRLALVSMQRPMWTKLTGSPEIRSLRTQQQYEGYTCGIFDYNDPAMKTAFEIGKAANKHCPPGHWSLNRQQTFELFWAQQGAMVWFTTDFIVMADRLKQSGQLKFEWDTFPTPEYDKETIGDVKALPIADISERGRQYAIPASNFRADKDKKGEEMAVDFLRFLSEPGVQEEYTGLANWVPVNPKAKIKDPRVSAFRKNTTPWYNQWTWFLDQPKWFQHWQAFVDDKTTFAQYAETMNKENKAEAERLAREQGLTLACGKYK